MTDVDVAIIGSGPSGLFSVFSLGQVGLRCALIDAAPRLGGQCAELYPDKPIYDIPGIPSCTGESLVQSLLKQIERFDPLIYLNERVDHVHECGNGTWTIRMAHTVIRARAIVLAVGNGCMEPRKLAVPGASVFEGKELLYSVKDIERFKERNVLILGGGDSALDWAVALEPIARRVTVLHRRNGFKAAPDSVAKLRSLVDSDRLTLKFGTVEQLHDGKGFSARIAHLDGTHEDMQCDFVLAFFGMAAKLGSIGSWDLSIDRNKIAVDPVSMQTSRPGIFAIGDVANYLGRLNLILTGFSEGALMSHAVYKHIKGAAPIFHYSTHDPMFGTAAAVSTSVELSSIGEQAERSGGSNAGTLVKAQETGAELHRAPQTELNVRVVDLNGDEAVLPGKVGSTLLEIMQEHDLAVLGNCFGCANCGTCHVYVDEGWLEALEQVSEIEEDCLDASSVIRPNSRLACQISFTEELSGIKIVLSDDTKAD